MVVLKISQKKKNESYNDYTLTLSWGQLETIKDALANHPEPVADEMLAELEFYLTELPGPGESEEDIKAREEAEAEANVEGEEGGKGGEGEEDDGGVPLPPNEAKEYKETTVGGDHKEGEGNYREGIKSGKIGLPDALKGPSQQAGEEDNLPEPPAE